MGSPLDHSEPPDYSLERFRRMMSNALKWKCPASAVNGRCSSRGIRCGACGIGLCRSMVAPAAVIRSNASRDIFCSSIFAINYGVGALIGLVIYLILDFCLHLPIWLVLTLTIIPMPIFNLLFARHSKALFLAFDLFFDPHRGEDDGGDRHFKSPAPPPKAPDLEPISDQIGAGLQIS